jgi:hypothetical protein
MLQVHHHNHADPAALQQHSQPTYTCACICAPYSSRCVTAAQTCLQAAECRLPQAA